MSTCLLWLDKYVYVSGKLIGCAVFSLHSAMCSLRT